MAPQWKQRDLAPKLAGSQSEPSYIPILRLKPGEKATAVMLDEPCAVDTHWIDGVGSIGCDGDGCQYCPDRERIRWYAPGIRLLGADLKAEPQKVVKNGRAYECYPEKWQRVIIELTPENMLAFDQLPCRNLRIDLSRAGAQGSHQKVRRSEKQTEAAQLPECWGDVKPILEKLWGLGRSRTKEGTTPIRRKA